MKAPNRLINLPEIKSNRGNLRQLKDSLESQRILYDLGKIAYILEDADNNIFAVIEKKAYTAHGSRSGGRV